MIRFIIRTKERESGNGYEGEWFTTFLADVPELESRLCVGGRSEHSFLSAELVGVEVVAPNADAGEST